MRRGLLKDYANQVCQMAVGWRLAIADLALLTERGHGVVTFDLLTRTAELDDAPTSLTIMDEVGAWIDEARTRDALPHDLIRRFTMRLDFHITEEKNGRADVRHVELDCASFLATPDGEYEGRSRKRELWTRTDPAAAWFVRRL